MTDNRVAVAETGEIGAGERKLVTVEGVEIGVFNLDGEYHAVVNTCPHQQGEVAEGKITREVAAEPPSNGEWPEERYTGTAVLRCPRHGWGFDITTGENVADRENAPCVVTYDVAVDDDTVYLVV